MTLPNRRFVATNRGSTSEIRSLTSEHGPSIRCFERRSHSYHRLYTDQWSVVAFGTNLQDERFETFFPIDAPSLPLFAVGSLNRPKHVRIAFEYGLWRMSSNAMELGATRAPLFPLLKASALNPIQLLITIEALCKKPYTMSFNFK